MREPDPQVVGRAARGDAAAFDALVRRYQPDVWRLALYLVQDRAAAEDVVQETFVRVFRFLPRFRGASRFSTWLFSITRNCARDAVRAATRESRLQTRAEASPRRGSDDQALRYEIKEAIAALPLELREPLVLVDVFEVSYAEAAAVLAVPPGTIKSRVFRARHLLMDALRADAGSATHEA